MFRTLYRNFAITQTKIPVKKFDVAVIGAGAGGYVAAIKAAQAGLQTVCIDDRPNLGGVCVNEGCIPSKALLNYTMKLRDAREQFEYLGIEAGPLTVDFGKMQQAKLDAVNNLTVNIEDLFYKYDVARIQGRAKFMSPKEVLVNRANGRDAIVTADKFIIATGSEPNALPAKMGLPFDEKYVCSSTGALTQTEIPKRLTIYGGGIVGIEIGSVYQRLGTEVTIVQRSERLAQFLDEEIGEVFIDVLKRQGMKFLVNHEIVTGTNNGKDGIVLKILKDAGEKTMEDIQIETDLLLISIGRKPNTANLNLQDAQVKVDPRGVILTNSTWQTNQPHIYGIGDCVKGTMLAHKAEAEAIAVVQHIVNGTGSVNYSAIPGVIYTHPEVGWIGKSQEDLVKEKTPFVKGIFPMKANHRASINHDSEGAVKILMHPETRKFLGIWCIGGSAGEMVAEGALAYSAGLTIDQVISQSHSTPTLSEAFREACMATVGKAIHV